MKWGETDRDLETGIQTETGKERDSDGRNLSQVRQTESQLLKLKAIQSNSQKFSVKNKPLYYLAFINLENNLGA